MMRWDRCSLLLNTYNEDELPNNSDERTNWDEENDALCLLVNCAQNASCSPRRCWRALNASRFLFQRSERCRARASRDHPRTIAANAHYKDRAQLLAWWGFSFLMHNIWSLQMIEQSFSFLPCLTLFCYSIVVHFYITNLLLKMSWINYGYCRAPMVKLCLL